MAATPLLTLESFKLMEQVYKEEKMNQQQKLIDSYRQLCDVRPTKAYVKLVDTFFEDLEQALDDFRLQQREDMAEKIRIKRLLTYHISVEFEGIGTFEIFTHPSDGSQIIEVISPIHDDLVLAFKYLGDESRWIWIDLSKQFQQDQIPKFQFLSLQEFLNTEVSKFTDGFLNLY